MKILPALLTETLKTAFEKEGLDSSDVTVQVSDRPDLADFQSNSAFALAKTARKNPREIAMGIINHIKLDNMFERVEVAGPGFINMVIAKPFLSGLMSNQQQDERCGVPVLNDDQTIVVDYGGPNVAKPLHVGHLRPAIIGESIKRVSRFMGAYTLGDIHLGDWGTPMGMLIAELEERHPEWDYFDMNKTDGFPSEPPVSVVELNTLYPEASTHFKSDEVFADKARKATAELQDGRAGYRALWRHFCTISLDAMKEDYHHLNVDFDLWLGESDVHDLIPEMIADMREKGLIVESDGALIIPVAKEGDKEEIPPLILVKKDGGYNYATTDLATIYDRKKKYNPDRLIYVVDTRQSLHFKQVFRVAVMARYMREDQMEHANFGTINGTDGKPYKTRDGGVMRLANLIKEAKDEAITQAGFDENSQDASIQEMLDDISVAAVKYGDLAINRQSDYVFDVKAFVQSEGKTGPYIQYACVRIQSILEKVGSLDKPTSIIVEDDAEKELVLKYLEFPTIMQRAFETSMPSILCEHVYLLSKAFNRFYGTCSVANEADNATKNSRITLCQMTLRQMKLIMVDLLGIDVPERMLRASDLEAVA